MCAPGKNVVDTETRVSSSAGGSTGDEVKESFVSHGQYHLPDMMVLV